jgi:uncharacterized protein involved in exopolysaccharide biosynthesis
MAEQTIDRTNTTEPYSDPLGVSETESLIDFVVLFRTLYRGRMTALAIALSIFASITIYAFLITPQFTSSASFIPPNLNNGSSMAAALAGQLSAIGVGDFAGVTKTTGDLYAGILRSRSIGSELVKRFGLMHVYGVNKESLAENMLAGSTDIIVEAKTSIVTVNVTGKEPKLAHDLANAYLDALRETEGRLALGQSSQRRLFFAQQLAKEKDDLEDAEVELKKTEEQSGLIEPSGQAESEIRTIAEIQAQVALRQVQLAALRDSATEQNPEVIRLHSEIEDLQGQLQRLQKGSNNGPVAAIPTSKVPQVQLDYVRKLREVKYHEALFDVLSKQYEAARLDEAHDAPVLQVLDPASFPDSKSSPKRMLYMLVGLILGVFAGCSWVLVREPIKAFFASLTLSGAG